MVLCTLVAAFASAQDFSLESIGIRVGGSPTSRSHNFHELDAFANFNLPLSFDMGANWRGLLRLDLTGGCLADHDVAAAIGTLGPTLLFRNPDSRVSVEVGSSPALLSREDFPTKDLGSNFQFSSHIGFNVDVSSRVRLGYRFQHMSNAGMAQPNPGLNLHMFSVSWLF